MSKTITLKQCKRCSHRWIPRMLGRPWRCPNCKNPAWDTAKPAKPPKKESDAAA